MQTITIFKRALEQAWIADIPQEETIVQWVICLLKWELSLNALSEYRKKLISLLKRSESMSTNPVVGRLHNGRWQCAIVSKSWSPHELRDNQTFNLTVKSGLLRRFRRWKVIGFWGFKENHGRIWAFLYLSPRLYLPRSFEKH